MGKFRDFDAARAEHVGEPLSFRLAGRDFTTTGEIPAGLLLDLGEAVASQDDGVAFGAFTAFFSGIVPPDQLDEFTAAIRASDLGVILDLLSWIVEESTGRPLGRPSFSPLRRAPNGASSNGDSVSWVSTPSP